MNTRKKEKRLSRQLEYIFAAIGYIFYLTSLIEYNLVQIISSEKYLKVFDKDDFTIADIDLAKKESNDTLHKLTNEKIMLGELINLYEKHDIVDKDLIKDLRKVSDIRGYYAHQFYKEDLYKRKLEKTPLAYKKKINSDVSFIYYVHQIVFSIAEDNRTITRHAKRLGL